MKKTLLPLLLAAVLALSGCSLVVKDPVVDGRQVILDINGETMDKAAFSAIYENALNNEYYMQQLYLQYGLVQSINVDREKVLKDSLDATVRHELLLIKAREMGLDAFTDEEAEALAETARTRYREALEDVRDYYFKDSPLTEEALAEAVEKKAAELGVTLNKYEEAAREERVHAKLEEEVTKDSRVGEEEIRSEYDERVSQAREEYGKDAGAYGRDVNAGETPYFAPEGYRFIKQVLVKFLPEDSQAMEEVQKQLDEARRGLEDAQAPLTGDAAQEAGQEEEDGARQEALNKAREEVRSLEGQLQSLKTEAYGKIREKAREIRDRAAAGEDFDALAAQYSEDPGMPARGYAVNAGFAGFDEAFVEPAMALAAPGEVSEPSEGIYGYYILFFSEEIPEGPLPFETVQEEIRGELLAERRKADFEAQTEAWLSEAVIRTYPERMRQD